MLWAAHVCCFSFSLLIIQLKTKGFSNTSGVVENLMLVGYLLTFSYVTYYTKKNLE
jgi:hypothetical protein